MPTRCAATCSACLKWFPGSRVRRAVIFDIDGTLLRSAEVDDRLYRDAVRAALGGVRLRESLHDYPHVTDTGILLQVFADNGIDATPASVWAVQGAFFASLERHIDEHGPFAEVPGARDYLARLEADPHTSVAIATGGWGASARMKLDSAGFDARNVPLASSDDAADRTAIMQLALDSLSGPHDDVLYYGDGDWDRRASRTLGWRFRAVGASLDGIRSFHAEP